jgi:N-acetylmuramoyl-L-alanine amidase
MKICIDAGHGGSDPGAIGTDPFRLTEKESNLHLAVHLERELENRGHWVVMTRRQDRTLSLSARAAFANRLEAEFFVSIHANAASSAAAEGMEVYHFPASTRGGAAAASILGAMLGAFPGHRNRGIKEANFAVLRLTAMPAVLVECEFLTNPDQLRFLADPDQQQALAAAIAGGVPDSFA